MVFFCLFVFFLHKQCAPVKGSVRDVTGWDGPVSLVIGLIAPSGGHCEEQRHTQSTGEVFFVNYLFRRLQEKIKLFIINDYQGLNLNDAFLVE